MLCVAPGSLAGWQGDNTKMSASDPNTAIYLTDTPEEVKFKVRTLRKPPRARAPVCGAASEDAVQSERATQKGGGVTACVRR